MHEFTFGIVQKPAAGNWLSAVFALGIFYLGQS